MNLRQLPRRRRGDPAAEGHGEAREDGRHGRRHVGQVLREARHVVASHVSSSLHIEPIQTSTSYNIYICDMILCLSIFDPLLVCISPICLMYKGKGRKRRGDAQGAGNVAQALREPCAQQLLRRGRHLNARCLAQGAQHSDAVLAIHSIHLRHGQSKSLLEIQAVQRARLRQQSAQHLHRQSLGALKSSIALIIYVIMYYIYVDVPCTHGYMLSIEIDIYFLNIHDMSLCTSRYADTCMTWGSTEVKAPPSWNSPAVPGQALAAPALHARDARSSLHLR